MEGVVSVDVCTMIPSATLAPLLPMVNPMIVMLNDDNELIEAPEIVITKELMDVALHVAVRPGTLLPPDATKGMMRRAKKLDG